MSNRTFGEIANDVRKAMELLGVSEDDAPRVHQLARVAVGLNGSTMDAWAVAGLILPDTTKLGPLDAEWTPAWPQHVTPEQTAAIRRFIAQCKED